MISTETDPKNPTEKTELVSGGCQEDEDMDSSTLNDTPPAGTRFKHAWRFGLLAGIVLVLVAVSNPTGTRSLMLHNVPLLGATSSVSRDHFCSSPDDATMTLKSWYLGHTNGGSGKWFQCEEMCRADPNCHSWMGRNSGNTCYLSNDAELKARPSGCCRDHHPHTFNLDNCGSSVTPSPTPAPVTCSASDLCDTGKYTMHILFPPSLDCLSLCVDDVATLADYGYVCGSCPSTGETGGSS